MTFDRRPKTPETKTAAGKTAAGKSFATYLNDIQVEFLKEVRKELLKGAIPDMSYDLHSSPPHIIFEGEIEAGEQATSKMPSGPRPLR